MRESKIETALREGVEALGGLCEKFSPQGQVGRPDRIITWPTSIGPFVLATELVETKAPDGELKSWQVRDHQRRAKLGHYVHVLWTLEHVNAYLESRGAILKANAQ